MSLTLRNIKGSPLTYTEMDDNLTYLEGVAGATGGAGILDTLSVSGTSSLNALTLSTQPATDASTASTINTLVVDSNGVVKKKEISNYTELIVNVSSAQILTMGDTPVEILPAPGAGKYYDIDWKSSFIEFTAGTSSYNTGTIDRVVFNYTDGYSSNMVTGDFLAESDNVIVPMLANMIWSTSSNVVIMGYTFLNTGLILQSFDASSNTENPTLGNGTMRIKVYYKEITFGA
jgi:hypothetical protein